MPEGFGYGGDEVKATTHNKTVKKATSQLGEEGKLIKRGIGKETPQQTEFRKQVESSVGDPSTRTDVLKAAGMGHLPGTGLTSKPPTPAPAPAQTGTPTLTEAKRARDMLRAAGFSAGEITVFMSKSPQARRTGSTRAQMRERFLRRKAATKYGTPP